MGREQKGCAENEVRAKRAREGGGPISLAFFALAPFSVLNAKFRSARTGTLATQATHFAVAGRST